MFQKSLVTNKLYGSCNRFEIFRCVPYIYVREKYGQTVVTRVDRLAKIRVCIAKCRCHLYSNQSCKENNVIPSRLRFRPPVRNAMGYKLMVRAGFSFHFRIPLK